MRKIDHLVIVAGPTASGKSVLLRELTAHRLPELHERIGIGNLHDWPQMTAGAMLRQSDLKLERLILHYDFLWPYPSSIIGAAEWRALSLLEGARQISIITLWTQPPRLAEQLIQDRFRGPTNRNSRHQRRTAPSRRKSRLHLADDLAEALRVQVFRLTPRPAILALAKFPGWKRLNRRLPTWGLVHHLVALRIYSDVERCVEMYRRWFDFCHRRLPAVREHVIVEFGEDLKVYTEDEWKNATRI
jgi:hypothetical protein